MANEYVRKHESFRSIDIDESAETIKATAGDVFGWTLNNEHATLKRFVKFYDSASAPTVGTTTPKLTIALSADSSNILNLPGGLRFVNGIYIAATTGIADSDTGSLGANEIVANVFYK
jgi:hypothetical protein